MTSTVSRLAAIAAVAFALAGCSTISDFFQPADNRPAGQRVSPGPRIPVLAADSRLTPSAALANTTFQIPEPVELTEWPYAGYSASQSPPHAAAAPAFQIAWRRSIGDGGGDGTRVTATPVAQNGRVFVMDAMARVSAWDAATGARVWSVDLRDRSSRDGEAFGGGLALADGRLYVTSGFRFAAALNPADGAVIWRQNTESPVHGAPMAGNGRVFFVDLADNLHALTGDTGEEVWNYQALIESARIAAASSPALLGDSVVAAFASGEVASFSVANGQPLWSEVLSRANRTSALSEIRDIPGRPVEVNGTIYAVSHSGVLAALDARSGNRRWELPIIAITSPLPAGDVIYTVDRAGQLVAAARETGQVYWARDLSAGRTQRTSGYLGLRLIGRRTIRPVWSSPILASNRLILTSTFWEALAVNPLTGAVEATLPLGAPAFVSPIAVNGMVFVVTENAELIAIR